MRQQTDRRGVAAVEFALVAPFLMFIILGGIEMGSLIRVQQKAVLAAREAAGYAAREPKASLDDIRLRAMTTFWGTKPSATGDYEWANVAMPSPRRDTLNVSVSNRLVERCDPIAVTVTISFKDALWSPMVLLGFRATSKSVAAKEF